MSYDFCFYRLQAKLTAVKILLNKILYFVEGVMMSLHDYEEGYHAGRQSVPQYPLAPTPVPLLYAYVFIAYLLGILFCYLLVHGSGYSMWWMILSPLWPILLVVLFIFLILAIPYNLLF